MRPALVLVLALVFAGTLARALGAFAHDDAPPPPAKPGVGCAHRAPKETCAVLFAGNSLTFVNDLPHTFARLAKSAGRAVAVEMAAAGGETLQQHVERADVATPLGARTFNVVVIQEQGQVPSAPDLRAGQMYPAARQLVALARAEPAQPLFYGTWGHQDGWPERGLIGFDQMQAALDEGYGTLADDLGVKVAPVGDAFAAARPDAATPSLVGDDGYHPSPAGTYLAACVFYATIFGADPRGLGYTAELSRAVAAQLQAVAARTVLG